MAGRKALVHGCDLLPFALVVATRKKHLRWVEKQFPDCEPLEANSNGARTWWIKKDGFKGHAVIHIDPRKAPDDFEVFAIAAHEAVHVKQFVLDDIGEEALTSEVEAYLVQWVVDVIMRAIYESGWRPS